MDARRNSRVKPGTAQGPSSTSRPTGRSQNRTASKPSGRKNSRVICDGSALLGGAGGRVSTKASDAQSNSLYRNVPTVGRTSDIFNPAPNTTKKDGFLVHKRGQGSTHRASSRPQQRANSNDHNEIIAIGGRKSTKNIDQQHQHQALLDTEGCADGDEDQNDTTAMSDLQSLNNFSYYGRGFYNRNQRVQESPAASDAVSMTYGQGFPTHPNNGPSVASFTNQLQQQKTTTNVNANKNTAEMSGPNLEYAVEEKMNNNLMKQFQPMFSEDRSIGGDNLRRSRQQHNYQENTNTNTMLNSVSDFSQINDQTNGGSTTVATTRGGSQSRAQLFAQAKETLQMQRSGKSNVQEMTKTATGFNRKNSNTLRNSSTSSASRAQIQNMTKTAQNFMPKKSAAATKQQVLPPKLPPRAAMSPAIKSSSLKSKNLSTGGKNNSNLLVSSHFGSNSIIQKPTEIQTPLKDNLYFAHNSKVHNQTQQTPQTETIYRKGARSISRKRTDDTANNTSQMLMMNLTQPDQDTSVQVISRKNLHQDLNNDQSQASLDQRLQKFNQNFNSSGHCKKHMVIGCEKCSFGSSKGSRVSSLDSANQLISRDILLKHKAAARSEIGGLAQAKLAKSVTKQFKKPKNGGLRNLSLQKSLDAGPPMVRLGTGRASSLPREQSSTLNADSSILEKANELRRSTKNSQVRNLTGKLIGFGKKGNRPSANMLPKSNSYAVSEVHVNVQGRQETSKANGRQDSEDSRGLSEYINLKHKGSHPNTAIPNFSRILSAKTSLVRQDISKQLVQNTHQDLLQNDVKKLAEEWEGDPHDPEFWKRLEGENSQTQLRKRQLVQGQEIKSKQLDIIEKQSNMFKQLRETDDQMSERQSMRGTTQMGFGARSSIQGGYAAAKDSNQIRMQAMSRQSQQSLFMNTLQPGQDEPIQTEIDPHDFSVYQQETGNAQQFGASIAAPSKRLMHQDPSMAVLTDYDIADEIGNFGMSIKHQIEFRDKSAIDKVDEDQNIEDLRKQQQQQNLLEQSQAPKQIFSEASNMFSGQTNKSQMLKSPPMDLGEIASAQRFKQGPDGSSVAGGVSSRTGNFPSDKQSKGKGDGQEDIGPSKPSCFEDQGEKDKDSEDAESFDEEKQKTQVLKDLNLATNTNEIEDQTKDNDEQQDDDVVEKGVSEKSNDDEDDRVKKEIQNATLANVVDYDDWLEARTQKEIERQSQIEGDQRQSKNGGFSPKSTISIPKQGVIQVTKMEESMSARKLNNMTQQIKSADKLATLSDNDIDDQSAQGGRSQNAVTKNLADTIREQQMRNQRPKTRGNPAIQVLDSNPEPTGELSSKNAGINGSSNFSARRRTTPQDTSLNDLNAKTTDFNATQIDSSDVDRDDEKSNTMVSPSKNARFQGLAGTNFHLLQQSQSNKGMITSELQVRSNAQMTAISSLREDDLMISASQVDMTEGGRSIRAKSKLDATDKSKVRGMMEAVENLAIQEESSSLKSVSPLTENSTSRKSLMISGNSPAKFNQTSPSQQNETKDMRPPQQLPLPPKKGALPPKSPLLANKLKAIVQVVADPTMPVIEEKSLAEENYVTQTRAHEQPTPQPTSTPQPQPIDNSASVQDDSMIRESYSGAKAPIGQRNQAVHDFLAFEDSDDDDFGVIVKRKEQTQHQQPVTLPQLDRPLNTNQTVPQDQMPNDYNLPHLHNSVGYGDMQDLPHVQQRVENLPRVQQRQQTQAQCMPSAHGQQLQDDEPRPPQIIEQDETPQNNDDDDVDSVLKLSPQRRVNLAKTPSAQFVPNTQFLKSNPNAMPHLGPALAEDIRKQVAKTPNTGLSNPKIKALQVENGRMQTANIPPVPMTINRQSIDESTYLVNEQIDRIDYNQSNDGMSASFYRNHDQWLAMQQMPQTNQTLRSHRSSRETTRMHKTQEQQRAGSQTRAEVHAPSRIVSQATQANKQVHEMRKSLQSLPKQQNQLPVRREDELRQSGTAVAAGYQRPQAYVKKAISKQNSKNNLNVTETSQERLQRNDVRQGTPDKFVQVRDGSTGRAQASFRNANSSIISTDSRGNKSYSNSKKQQFFAKHKDSIGDEVTKTQKKRESSQDARAASKNRLYNQETIASILKRNPELAYATKDKKPPTMPPRRPAKKKVVKPPTPESPKEDPPEEPLANSPRVLQLPIEASIPNQESAPTNRPLPIRLPEEPPLEPVPFVMPNLYCPVDPDTPFNFEIEPRDEEQHFAPLDPVSLRMPYEPEEPPYPERMIKMNTNEYMSEVIDEDECLRKTVEPLHDDEPILEYPKQERVLVMAPDVPSKLEPDSLVYLDEPITEGPDQEGMPTQTEPSSHYLTQEQVERTHEMSIQCDNPDEESKEDNHLATINEEQSDEDNFSVHSCEGAVNKVTVGIQTNEAHFRNVERTQEYARKKQEQMESTDWAFSPIFDEIHFAKEKKTIGGRKIMTSIATQVEKFENGGNQVEQRQIIEETSVQILSQIECEYNVDQLKRKMSGKDMSGKDAVEDERLTELYMLGLNTLKALMLGLRLSKEWEIQTKHQYCMPADGIITDPEETVKLLIRNKKMYEAKTLIQRLLKMIVQRDQMVEDATKLEQPASVGGMIIGNISLKKPQPVISKDQMTQIKRLSTRITSQINTLQEEHRIFKRPFILQGQEYLSKIQDEAQMLEDLLNRKFYVDESGTTGSQANSSSFKSAATSQK